VFLPPERDYAARGAGLLGGDPARATADIEDCGDPVAGRVHSIDTPSTLHRHSIDGHGIRCIAFLQGCEKRCAFCCNVDSTNAALAKTPTPGRSMTPNDIVEILKRNLKYYASSGGGLTLSGGECLLQPAFVEAVARKTREIGLTVAIDTAASGDAETCWNRVLPHVDVVLLCVKSSNVKKYETITGTTQHEYETMRAFLKELDHRRIKTWLRFVLMSDPDARFDAYRTNDESELLGLSELAKAHDCVAGIELLPYHRFGEFKFAELGLEYKLEGMRTPSAEEIQSAQTFLQSRGVTVIC
jgi:pyruvate-formate lyase-activating enzyme